MNPPSSNASASRRYDLPTATIRTMFKNDFLTAWNLVAGDKGAAGRGNFMFGLVAMDYLEWASRAARANDRVWREFVRELRRADSRYFRTMPAGWRSAPKKWFPRSGTRVPALWVLFDVVRNGLAHKYQQPVATLSDDSLFGVSITGAEVAAYPESWAAAQQRRSHLSARAVRRGKDNPPFVVVLLHPDVLFHDVDRAVENARVTELPPIQWPWEYKTTHGELARVLTRKVAARPR